ncbi:SMI1/KNR4 family protein [Aquimarina algiphila]|uniref:SMI1/KNR4 family protein n=1 Tax=Aquimarina algiphila TaxID=2047982 RepID=UPI00232B0FCD|nr:SMI1/KNR4 family protein [Aquimarina algiphila]
MKPEEIFSFLKEWYGKPDYHFEYNNVSDELLMIYILVYLPIPKEGNFTSTIITAGFSSLGIQLYEHKVECVFELKGTLTEMEYEKLGRELVKQFNECIPFLPNGVHSPIVIKSYPYFTGCLILNYGKHESHIWETDPTIRVFELIPLYKEEVKTLSEQPIDITNAIIFRSDKVDWTDWERSQVNPIEEATSGVWDFIVKWYEENSPRIFSQLGTGANRKSIIQLNEVLGVLLPDDFIASLMIYNGEVEFHDYKYLSSTEIAETWTMMKELLDSNSFPAQLHNNRKIEEIKEVWWHENWIPFAKDGGGNLMCLDMNPTPSGNKGQIIYWEKTEGPIPTQYKSFFHWLYTYEQGLYGGYYKVDEEGFIYY